MRIKPAIVALTLIALTASVYAQTAAPPSPAAVLLRERSQLQLSAAQVKKLQELDRRYTREARPAEERLLRNRAAERRLRAREKDLSPAERQELSRDRAAMRKAAEEVSALRRANREAAWKVLTPAQRTKAEQIMRERAQRSRGVKQPRERARKPMPQPLGRPHSSFLQLLPY